jgi:protein phosphatase 2C family protein 2/3
VAQYAGHHLHKFLIQRPEYSQDDVPTALRQGFLEFDATMLKDELMRDELAGTTAVTVLIRDKQLYCANVGDSRAVACVGGTVDPLSADHKPNNPEESARIARAGGWVEYNRVNGNLALSRALGDFVFKRNAGMGAEEQMVIALPDVEARDVNEEWEFVLLACDGIWDVVTNEEAVEFVRRRLSMRQEPETICEELMTTCLAPDCQMGGLGCDNMTVILVCFLHGKSYEELCAKVASTLNQTKSPESSSGDD